MSKIISEEIKQQIVTQYKIMPITIDELVDKFKLCRPVISKILHEYNCHIYTKEELYTKNVNTQYFDTINTEEQAYYLGLFMADGCVYAKNNYRLFTITLQESDKYILEKFNKIINNNRKLVIDKRTNAYTLSIVSTNFINSLAKYGLVEGKNNRYYMPIDNSLICHYIRGLIDGDGSIYKKYNSCRNTSHYCVTVSGNYQICLFIKQYLINKFNVNDNQLSLQDNIYSIRWAAKDDVYNILNFIYGNATIYLKRKYKHYIQFLTEY